jgi:gliding motility-associated-like protein
VGIKGKVTNATGVWTTYDGTGTFSLDSTITNAKSYILSKADTALRTVHLVLKAKGLGACANYTAKDTLTIHTTPEPHANLSMGHDTSVCANTPIVGIKGKVTNATGVWYTYDGTGTFSLDSTIANAASYILSKSDTALRTVHLVLKAKGVGACANYTAKDTLTIHTTPEPHANLSIGHDTSVCANTPIVGIKGKVTNATGVWTTYDGTGTFSLDSTIANATSYILSKSDTALRTVHVVLKAKGIGACANYTAKDTLTIHTTPEPHASLLMTTHDTSICANVFNVPIHGKVTSAIGTWSTYDGTGLFLLNNVANNTMSANSYSLSLADTAAGLVHLVINAKGYGACNNYTDYDTLKIKTSPPPFVSVGVMSKDTTHCNNVLQIVLKKANVQGSTGGIWTSSGTGGSFSPSNTSINPVTYNLSSSDTAKPYIKLTLTSTGNRACNAVFDTLHVKLNKAPHAVYATTNSVPMCKNDASLFNASASRGIVAINAYYWKFGDGLTATGMDTSHTYASYGIYTASLTVVDANGCRDSVTQPITIHSLPMVNFSSTANCFRNAVYFKDLTPPVAIVTNDVVTKWYWSFGDGNQQSTLIPTTSHSYASPNAAYIAKLTDTTNYGCVGFYTQTLNVTPAPVAKFSADSVCLNNVTHFTDLSTPLSGPLVPLTYTLNLGDNTTPFTNLNTPHKYPFAKNYLATLIVLAQNGCYDTISDSVVVHPLPQANFTASVFCSADSTYFKSTSTISSGKIKTFFWNFGDGTLSSGQNITHKFPVLGAGDNSFGVTLRDTSEFKCAASYSAIITIHPSPIAAFISDKNIVELHNSVQFTNNSTAGKGATDLSSNWSFGDTATAISTAKTPSYKYDSKSGTFPTKLVVTNSFNCSDSATKDIIVKLPPKIPNVFTPDGDGRNDVLYVLGGPYKKLEFRILNNWGEFIFYSTNQSLGWDGTKNGVKQPIGVYVYTITATTEDGEEHTLYGDVTLMR